VFGASRIASRTAKRGETSDRLKRKRKRKRERERERERERGRD